MVLLQTVDRLPPLTDAEDDGECAADVAIESRRNLTTTVEFSTESQSHGMTTPKAECVVFCKEELGTVLIKTVLGSGPENHINLLVILVEFRLSGNISDTRQTF